MWTPPETVATAQLAALTRPDDQRPRHQLRLEHRPRLAGGKVKVACKLLALSHNVRAAQEDRARAVQRQLARQRQPVLTQAGSGL